MVAYECTNYEGKKEQLMEKMILEDDTDPLSSLHTFKVNLNQSSTYPQYPVSKNRLLQVYRFKNAHVMSKLSDATKPGSLPSSNTILVFLSLTPNTSKLC
jgi:hypothetical protein